MFARIVHFLRQHILWTVLAALVVVWLMSAAEIYYFEAHLENSNIKSFGDGLWWGIVTFLTVGYGDRYPVTTEGRLLGSILMLFGVLAMGVVTAKISSIFLSDILKEGKGIVNARHLDRHMVICGWKDDMGTLLEHVLDYNPTLGAEKMVLVASVNPDWVADLKENHPRLKQIQFIHGEYYHEAHLRRAAPEKSRKVLILADRTPNATGVVPTVTEIDARTIMTAMTLSNISRGVDVAAEILDPKMDQYLKIAHVTEIIYSREYSRLLLGTASGGTGVANILFDLLDPKTPSQITTFPLTDEHEGRAFADLKEHLENTHAGLMVLGVLENTGNAHSIKDKALRQAQKTPDAAALVKNLQRVKELRYNHPVFNPPADYRISSGSSAIVIVARSREDA